MCTMADRVVIITGAVGNLGFATARAFHRAGAKTVLVDRATDRLGRRFPEHADSPDHVLAGGIDLTDADAVGEMVEQARGRFGRLDVLVNTVGGFRAGKPVHEDDLGNWDFLFDLNVRTALNVCRAIIPHMLELGGGKIINVASRNALAGAPKAAAYSATKAALLRLTESLAAELKPADINVNCVLPGTIDTPANREAMPRADRGKWVSPGAVADVIVFLASDAARGIHGAAVPVFGKA